MHERQNDLEIVFVGLEALTSFCLIENRRASCHGYLERGNPAAAEKQHRRQGDAYLLWCEQNSIIKLLGMDWEEIAITELYKRFESIYRSVDKAVFPGLCNSLLQQSDTWPVLSDGIAYLTGATDRFGSPVIFISSNIKSCDTSEQDFRGTIKYLVAATNASSADVGFVVVIDSRQSRWSSLAWVLRNVASCFPGELKMILAIRPTNFLHGTLSTIAMRYQKDEYNYKVPIELLPCTESFWPWIPKEDLPREIGGELQYDHSSWLRRRLITENLATILKRVIQRCKSYCTNLVNSQDFPDNINDESVVKQNEECENVMREVDILQDKGNEILADDVWWTSQCDKEPVSTCITDVQHLCSLILEVKDTFHTFWRTYEDKRAGYLQLKSFERNYKSAATRISCLIENLEICSSTEANNTTDISPPKNGMTEVCLKACEDGEGLMRDHPYAIDCIKPKCDELKRLSQCFQTLMEEKIQHDEFVNRTKELIQEVNEWSGRGMKLLSVQNLDKAKTPDGVCEALDELEAFTLTSKALKTSELRDVATSKNISLDQLENSIEDCLYQFDLVLELFEKRKVILQLHQRNETTKDVRLPKEKQDEIIPVKNENTAIVHPIPKMRPRSTSECERIHKLKQVINELVETEKKYVEELAEIVQGYGHVIDDESMTDFLPEELKSNRQLLLGNLEKILVFHRSNLLPDLIECHGDEVAIANLFITKSSRFSLYYEYCHESNNRKTFRKKIGENHVFFSECQRRLGHRLPLSAYLLKPIQRITKYQLLLQQMEKYGQKIDPNIMTKAISSMVDVLRQLNDSMHEISITGFTEDFSMMGRLLMQASFQIQTETRKGKVKDFARSKFNKALVRHMFLYENGLIICKKCENGDDVDGNSKAKNSGVRNFYQFKRHVKAKQFSLIEQVKGCPRKFRLHCHSDDAELTITTPSNTVKQNWIKSLQNCASLPKNATAGPESPAKRVKTEFSSKASPNRKRLDSVSSQDNSADVRHSKLQRSTSLGKNATKPSAKSFLGRQKSFAVGDASKLTKDGNKLKKSRERSKEVTSGNIHGVENRSLKNKVRNQTRQEKSQRDDANPGPRMSKKTTKS